MNIPPRKRISIKELFVHFYFPLIEHLYYTIYILIDGAKNCDKKELVLRKKSVIQGTKLSLSYIGRFNWDDRMDTSLFEKCLQGEQLTSDDFSSLVNFEFPYGYLLLSFRKLRITIRAKEIEIKKWFDDYYNVSEEFTCCIAKERVMITDLFFEFILRAETKRQLLSGIGEYFFGEGLS